MARSIEAVAGGDGLGLALEVDRDRHDDLLVQVDLDEVDVLDVALDRVALDVLDERRVHGAVDGEVEDRVHARSARQRLAQLAAIDRHGERIHAVAVHDGGDLALGAQATRSRRFRRCGQVRRENGLRHGDRLPSELVTAPHDGRPGRYSSIPSYRPPPAIPSPGPRHPDIPKMRTDARSARRSGHFSEVGGASGVDSGDLPGRIVQIVSHGFVEADDHPADFGASSVTVLVPALGEVTAVEPRRPRFDGETDVGPRDVQVDCLTGWQHERMLTNRPAHADHFEVRGCRSRSRLLWAGRA